jgi:GTP-dependent dephospho-CoA kinase
MSTASSPSKSAELTVPPKGWRLTERLRGELAMPFGTLLRGEELPGAIPKCEKLITVGDMVSTTLINKGVIPHLTIYDRRNERRELDASEHPVDLLDVPEMVVDNPPGLITPELIKAVKDGLDRKGKVKVRVQGEEDLAALVCAAIAPAGCCLLYGLPGKGVVLVMTDTKVNRTAQQLIRSMEVLK